MQDQSSSEEQWIPDSDEIARVVLGLLVKRHPGLVAEEELRRELSHPSLERPLPEPFIEDGLAELTRSGLIHRLGSFVFASQTAIRADDLAL